MSATVRGLMRHYDEHKSPLYWSPLSGVTNFWPKNILLVLWRVKDSSFDGPVVPGIYFEL